LTAAAKIGIRNHSLLHDFEVAHQRFVRLGIEPHQARRMALYAALRLTEVYSDREAWDTVNAILGPKQRSPVELTSTNGTEPKSKRKDKTQWLA
jgi:hypothetical protein